MFSLFRANLQRNVTHVAQASSTLLSTPSFGILNPIFSRGFKVRTAVKKFCADCYVCIHVISRETM